MIAEILDAQESEVNDFSIALTGCSQRRALLATDWHVSFSLKQAAATSPFGSSEIKIEKRAVAALSDPAFEAQVFAVLGFVLDVDSGSFVTDNITRDLGGKSNSTKADTSVPLIVVGVIIWMVVVAAAVQSFYFPASKLKEGSPSPSPILPTNSGVRDDTASTKGPEVLGPWVEMTKAQTRQDSTENAVSDSI